MTRRKNDELLGALDEIALELERVDNIYDTVPLLNVVANLRYYLSVDSLSFIIYPWLYSFEGKIV